MKLSTRSRYGLRLMCELAMQFGRNPVILREIAERQKISGKYLSKLVILLRRVKLVRSLRGIHGGYTLTRSPAEITVREILQALEGDLSLVDCVKKSSCRESARCLTRNLWCRLDAAFLELLEKNTLQTLLDDYKSTH